MKSKTKIIISYGIVLFLTTAVLVWSWSTGCFDNFSVNEQQRHEELLTILIKATGKEHFLSRLDDLGILYFITKEESKDVVYFKNGSAEFENGTITSWLYHNSNVRIPAIPEEIVEKLRNSQTTSAEVVKRFGMPSAMDYDKEGNLTFTYIFLRDENAKRTDGTYNAELTLLFEKNKLQDYWFSIIYDLNQKSSSEIFL